MTRLAARRAERAVLLLCFAASTGCAGSGSSTPATEAPACTPPDGVTGSPSSIGDVITLANGLLDAHPGEVTLACLVESLDRPLGILPVNSLFSVQPAVGRRSPRIFLFTGDLVMAVAAEGSGADLLELAEYTSPTRSIKAEMQFPLHDAVAPSLPYDRVRLQEGTSCGGCHQSEVPAPQVTIAAAFDSDVLRPRTEDEVSIPFLESETLACDPQIEAERCAMLTAVFGHGEVQTQRFSPDARTIYDN